MQANPSKFQAFVLEKHNIDRFTIISADQKLVNIECEKTVKLLGVSFDNDFSFNSHIKDISKRAQVGR